MKTEKDFGILALTELIVVIQLGALVLVVWMAIELGHVHDLLREIANDTTESVEVLEPSDLKGACNR